MNARVCVYVRAHAFVFVRACLAEAKWGVASTRNFFSCSAGESIGTSACANSENRCMRASQPPGGAEPIAFDAPAPTQDETEAAAPRSAVSVCSHASDRARCSQLYAYSRQAL